MKRMFLALAAVALLATPAAATDGHYLHGVGAVNSTMGGAGVAQPKSLLGTFYLNPAGLMGFDGTRMEFSLEMFKADRTVSSTVGPFSGSTRSTSLYTPIPAMGVSYRLNNDKVVVGLGAVGVGGFGVDYARHRFSVFWRFRPLAVFKPIMVVLPTFPQHVFRVINDW